MSRLSKISIQVPADLLHRIDDESKLHRMSRSEFVRAIIDSYFERKTREAGVATLLDLSLGYDEMEDELDVLATSLEEPPDIFGGELPGEGD